MPAALAPLRVALVHDFLNQPGGAEKVVEVFAEMFPGAPIYTSVFDPDRVPDFWRRQDVRTSFMQRISPRMGIAKSLLPLFPMAFESFDLSEYDMVLSSTTSFAKGVITRPHTFHACYCHNPTRFLWTSQEYLRYERLPRGARAIFPWVATPLRVWDYAAAQRVDSFIASSRTTSRRIGKFYRRESDIVHPPIECDTFFRSERVDDYFLIASRLQSYKRIDLAVAACTALQVPLHVVGDGPDRARLQARAGPTVRFLGRISDSELREEMTHCRAFIFPGEEDFGLAPLEAQASGRPVIAYAAGGALETVRDGMTGVFFREQSVDALTGCLRGFEDCFDPAAIQAHARGFDKAVFKQRMYQVLEKRYEEYAARFLP